MKAMNTTVNHNGDDTYFDRLLSYFRTQFHEKIIMMVPIRKLVILLKTYKNTYVVKGYQTNNKLRLQEAFTTTLKKEGFTKTYSFVAHPVKGPLFFEGSYFGVIEYIESNRTPFSFQTPKNRREGLELLTQFHQVTATFEARYRTLLAKANLIEKWKERLQIFLNNIPILRYFMNEPFISEICEWAKWSLDGMEHNQNFFHQEPFVILHGDVAHHNFLRDEFGDLMLIDFDLISIGPGALDVIQYANRILPYLDWSFGRLISLKQVQKLMDKQAFLFALGYPADIFREWNRIIREKTFTDPAKVKQVMELTIGQFYTRKQFFDTLKTRV